ncbi:Aste57867_21943 [Aphanomyces stellatus]|uniref:Aste57867_21943 protein n=1 Tax=Aphanomyces stellatus TaxID=120398 RepID=A0A485LJJ5_9STRA|nr:hypothetical protein As57867_021874 [Aphanomyces stellatus]VFT98611.1 Aste57867_21943 [Aphanomyces stellatus]
MQDMKQQQAQRAVGWSPLSTYSTTSSTTPRLAAATGSSNSSAYRGRCKYKSGRCPNERTLKYNGEEIHSLCEEHRIRHNRNQRKADTKRRKGKDTSALSSPTPSSARSVLDDASPSKLWLAHPPILATPPFSPLSRSGDYDDDDDDDLVFQDLLSPAAATDIADLDFNLDDPVWSNEDVAILLEYFVDSKC